jgi:hypothetical protein
MQIASVLIKVNDDYGTGTSKNGCQGCPFDNGNCEIVLECPVIQKDAEFPNGEEVDT